MLADLARKQMRKKIPALREALEGHFDSHHRLWIGAILRHNYRLKDRDLARPPAARTPEHA